MISGQSEEEIEKWATRAQEFHRSSRHWVKETISCLELENKNLHKNYKKISNFFEQQKNCVLIINKLEQATPIFKQILQEFVDCPRVTKYFTGKVKNHLCTSTKIIATSIQPFGASNSWLSVNID